MMIQDTTTPGKGRELCNGAGCSHRTVSGHAKNRVIPGGRLCPACQGRLTADLGRLPGLYEECGRILGGALKPAERTSGGPMPGLPFNSGAADVRSAILGILGSWTAMVADERHVTRPQRTAAAMAAFLCLHADWLARHPAAADASVEISEVTGRARHLWSGEASRRVPVGQCVEADCPGDLVALVRTSQMDRSTRIICSTDPGHSWLPDQWLQLSRRIGATSAGAGNRKEQWLAAPEIARLWHLAPGSVYRLASEHRWRRRSQAGRTYYQAADVEASLRRPTAAAS